MGKEMLDADYLIFFRDGWGSARRSWGREGCYFMTSESFHVQSLSTSTAGPNPNYQWLEENIRFRKPHNIKIYVSGWADFTKFTLVKYEWAWYDRKF